MNAQILRLNKAGTPTAWINFEEAATLIAKELVLWSMGGAETIFHGGKSRMTGKLTTMEIPPIIAVDGRIKDKMVPRICNRLLFARDGYLCMYCGDEFKFKGLTRDHITPTSKGGADTWENCCASCSRCNHFKGSKTLEQTGMQLLAVPYAPNWNEWIALENRNILSDQMDYLRGGFKNLVA